MKIKNTPLLLRKAKLNGFSLIEIFNFKTEMDLAFLGLGKKKKFGLFFNIPKFVFKP